VADEAALAFMPAAKTQRQRAEVPKLIMVAGAGFAVTAGLIASGIPLFLPQLFSPDVRLYPYMQQIAPLVKAPRASLFAPDPLCLHVLHALLLFLARARSTRSHDPFSTGMTIYHPIYVTATAEIAIFSFRPITEPASIGVLQ
jgi:hypothetical protein